MEVLALVAVAIFTAYAAYTSIKSDQYALEFYGELVASGEATQEEIDIYSTLSK